MNRAEIKEEAKQTLSGNWGITIGVLLTYMIIVSLLTQTGIGYLVLGGAFELGLAIFFLALIRHKKLEFALLFKGFNNFGKSLEAFLLKLLYVFLWTLLLIIPGIIAAYSYYMTFFILKDNPEISGSEAIRRSKEMMDGYKSELFILHLSFFGWFFLTVITFGIAAFYVYPYFLAANAVFYQKLKDLNGETAETKKVKKDVDAELRKNELLEGGTIS